MKIKQFLKDGRTEPPQTEWLHFEDDMQSTSKPKEVTQAADS